MIDFEQINPIRIKSILSFVPDDHLTALLSQCQVKTFSKGEIISNSIPLKTMTVAISGLSDIFDKISGSKIETIGPGKSFELGTLISEKKRWLYDWIASGEVIALLIPFEAFVTHVEPQYMDYLKLITQHAELQKFKNDLRLVGVEEKIIRYFVSGLKQTDWSEAKNSPQSLFVISDGNIEFFYKKNELVKLATSDYFIVKDPKVIESKHLNDVKGWMATSENLGSTFTNRDSILRIIDILNDKMCDFDEALSAPVIIEDPHEDISEPVEEDKFEIEHFIASDQESKIDRKTKPIHFLQHDMMDCAAACMSMISKYYKRNINIATWRSIIHVTKEGASMLSVKKGCDKVGFDSIGVMVSFNGMRRFKTPFIALMSYHYVVVYRVFEDSIEIADPEKGYITLSKDKFVEDYSNNILALRPNENLKSFPESKSQFHKYWFFVTDHKRELVEILFFSLIILILSLIHPIFLQFIFDNVLVGKNLQGLHFFAGIAVAVNMLTGIINYSKSSMVNKFTALLNAKFSSLLFRHILKLPLDYFAIRNVGDITSRVDELEKIQKFISQKAVSSIINIITIILYASILYLFHPSFVVLLIASGFVITVVIKRNFKKMKSILQETFAVSAKSISVAFEQIRALKTISNMSGTLSARWRWETVFNRLLEQRYKFQNLVNVLITINVVSQHALNISFLILSIYLYTINELTLGQIVAISAVSSSLIRPLIGLIADLDDIDKVKISLEKIDELVTARTEISPASLTKDLKFEEIEFRDVWFRYGGDLSPWTLKGINLKIKKGEVIAFVGPSGSGKSTLAYMLNLLYEPVKGEIFIDGINVKNIPLQILRTNISMILQDQASFSGNILENIAIGDTNPNLKKAIECSTIAHAHDFITSMPKAYMTELGDGKQGLSGGQHQRLNIARAIYKNPKILILDEATSALDTITERIVVKNLKEVSSEKTTFIIAHRLNTIIHADKIVVIKNGSIVESGNHQQLMAKPQGLYNSLFKKQINV